MYRNKVTEKEFVDEMLIKGLQENNFTKDGLTCLFRYLEENDEISLFDVGEINKEFTEYKGLKDYNTKNNTNYCSVTDIPCFIEMPGMDGFFQN